MRKHCDFRSPRAGAVRSDSCEAVGRQHDDAALASADRMLTKMMMESRSLEEENARQKLPTGFRRTLDDGAPEPASAIV